MPHAGNLVRASDIGNTEAGAISGTTNASGDLTVSHSLGVTPTAVFIQESTPPGVAAWGMSRGITLSATSFTFRALDNQGNVLTSTAITGYYVVFE